jgi:hypothetical protein
MAKRKEWKSIEVKEFLDTGDVRNGIEEALNDLSADGYEPGFVTHVGASGGAVVVVSGWRWRTTK